MGKIRIAKIAGTDDLHIAPFREDGMTIRDTDVDMVCRCRRRSYALGYNGTESRWYQAALRQKAGRIIAAGMTKEVIFESGNESISSSIDDAYRSKYGASPYLKPMISPRARAATVRIMPRAVNR